MRLKNKKGMTAMVDAMIFIVVLGLAVSAMFAFTGSEPAPDNASRISDNIFTSKLRSCDVINTEESGLVNVSDMVAFYFLTGEGNIMQYIKSIMDSLMQRPGSYRLEITYGKSSISIGSGTGDPISSYHKEYNVTYGGIVKADLMIY
jgi:hypothetical protein